MQVGKGRPRTHALHDRLLVGGRAAVSVRAVRRRVRRAATYDPPGLLGSPARSMRHLRREPTSCGSGNRATPSLDRRPGAAQASAPYYGPVPRPSPHRAPYAAEIPLLFMCPSTSHYVRAFGFFTGSRRPSG